MGCNPTVSLQARLRFPKGTGGEGFWCWVIGDKTLANFADHQGILWGIHLIYWRQAMDVVSRKTRTSSGSSIVLGRLVDIAKPYEDKT